MNLVRNIAIIALFALFGQAGNAATTLLPNGKQCFSGVNGAYSSGSLNMFIPNTTTPKATWQDPNQASSNTQPIQLDANGCAVIYGVGSYRQQLFDGPVVGGVTTGNLIWDQLTTDTSASNSVFWAGLSNGTPNAITLVDPGFNNTPGSVINFLALQTNTGATTISVSGGLPIQVVKDTSTGPVALSGGEIVSGNIVSVTYDATGVLFHIEASQSSTAQTATTTPQGYLNLVGQASGDVVQPGDVTAATQVFYSPFVGSQIPIYNGVSFVVRTFPELTLALSSAGQLASSIYDVCIFNNAGSLTMVTGPAWTNSGAGTGSRGTGTGTPQLVRINGIWVNAVAITGVNGANSFSIPANQCTYVGSLSIDSTSGQVSAYRSYGQSRKFGIWNAYNRQAITMQAGDTTSTWTIGGGGSAALRALNGSTTNSITVFTGLPEEPISFSSYLRAQITQSANSGSQYYTGIGFNSTSTNSGIEGTYGLTLGTGVSSFTWTNSVIGNYSAPPSLTLGINVVTALEGFSSAAPTAFGGAADNNLTANYRG